MKKSKLGKLLKTWSKLQSEKNDKDQEIVVEFTNREKSRIRSNWYKTKWNGNKNTYS